MSFFNFRFAKDYELRNLKCFFIVCRFAKDYELRNRDALRDGSNYLANPVNAFLIVKRLTADWNYVETIMRQNAADSEKKIIKNIL